MEKINEISLERRLDLEVYIADQFKHELEGMYKNIFHSAQTRRTNGSSTAYVNMRKRVKGGRNPHLTRYLVCRGGREVSLIDPVEGVHGTTFPS